MIRMFNLSDEPHQLSLPLSELGGSAFSCRELWSGETVSAQRTLAASIEPHGARLFKCTPR